MGEDEDYARGVSDGQRGGILDDFCQGLANTSSAYDKGYNYGVDNRRDSSGERYHTWSNDGKNDPKPETSSDTSSSWSWFGSGNNSSKSDNASSESENNTSSNGGYSGGGYSCGGGGSGGNSSVQRCLGTLGIIAVGSISAFLALGLNISNRSPSQKPAVSREYENEALEKTVERFSQYLRRNNLLIGNFDDYKLIIPPQVNSEEDNSEIHRDKIEIAFINPRGGIHYFQILDRGKAWSCLPPSNPFLIKLSNDYVEEIRKRGKLSNDWIEKIRGRWNYQDFQAHDDTGHGFKERGVEKRVSGFEKSNGEYLKNNRNHLSYSKQKNIRTESLEERKKREFGEYKEALKDDIRTAIRDGNKERERYYKYSYAHAESLFFGETRDTPETKDLIPPNEKDAKPNTTFKPRYPPKPASAYEIQ